MRHRKILFVIAVLAVVCALFNRCVENANAGTDPRGPRYAGAASCVGCHREASLAYAHAHHAQTSSVVNDSLLQVFVKDTNNTAWYADGSMVRMEKRNNHYYQSLVKNGATLRSDRVDFVIGSAEKAQTYASWKNSQLMQLPLTYFAPRNSWTNSPGYPLQQPYFDRVILARCLECHASFVEKTDVQTASMQVSETLARNSIVAGIDCERCHGAAAEHVSFHRQNPGSKQAKFITSIKNLSRQQQLDLCSVCHSGNDLDVSRTLFAFQPGDTLSDFFLPHFGSGKPDPDVHGKQMQLLAQSKCFNSSQMTCGTCHDAHSNAKDAKLFVAKCMTCHQASSHAVKQQTATTNCVDCHMPLQASKALDFNNGKERRSISYWLRTHRIAVYKEGVR